MVVSSSSLSSSCSSAWALAFASSSFFFSSSSCSSFSSLSSGRFPKKKALHRTSPTGIYYRIFQYRVVTPQVQTKICRTYYSCALTLGSYKSSFHLSLLHFPAQLKYSIYSCPNLHFPLTSTTIPNPNITNPKPPQQPPWPDHHPRGFNPTSSSSPSESGPKFLAIADKRVAALVEAVFCFSAAMKVAVRSAWSTVSNLGAGAFRKKRWMHHDWIPRNPKSLVWWWVDS